MDTSSITVQAQYSFKGSNNDELCFKKGEIITLTQREEGGWWEGTLGDKTGWFPSNYVKEYAGPLPLSETIRPPEEIQAFRSVVYRDLLESEKAHVAELRGMVENFLEPLETSQILSAGEYTQLMCNFVEVVEMHEEFLLELEESNDRVGKTFLSKAPTMKKLHQAYCAAHPRAIVIVDKFREELNVFMEKQGAAKPGLLVLTTGLSKPFRRVDKYAAILQELERHMESGHPDRGDTQRSIAVYKDIASSCSATRRQKELELQILTGPVRGWQGAELSTLGDIIHMGSVAVGPEHKDRYLVLFPQTLLILSVSQRMSAFKYEGKLPLTGITVSRLDDTDQIKHAFEISGPLIDRIVAVCQGPAEANRWVELLGAKSGHSSSAGQEPQSSGGMVADLKRNVSSSAVNIPQPPPHMSPPAVPVASGSTGSSHPSRSVTSSIVQHMSQHKRSQSFNHHLSYNQVVQQQQQQQQQLKQHPPNPSLLPSQSSLSTAGRPEANLVPVVVASPKSFSERANWNITNLRPSPPLRPAFLSSIATGGSGGGGTGRSVSITGSIGGAAGSCVGGGSGNSGGAGSGSGSLNNSDAASHHPHHHSLSFSPSAKLSPTYEEDALVLRVIEAYCAAYQSTSRNTMHSGVEYDEMTPTLRQLFKSVRQLQQEMAQVKVQIAEERTQRGHLQQMLLGHMETHGAANTTC
ncbi:rho guanine nucleotide exchange factor 7 isoform X1 [Anopheles bellator]|uniref:rho guanine nucleotide exchange factor 7 isoform X1 n=1 Tax=Anopheles bellator TaxID=139047 RepID=UPI002649E5B1|nr:rho guanine nucleotide exchange factor 7 isoform X1 [Anopheles bellator]